MADMKLSDQIEIWNLNYDRCGGDQNARLYDEAKGIIEAQEAEIKRLRGLVNVCLIGGNHLAHILIKNLGANFCDKYPYLADNIEILEKLWVGDNYDVWCAWSQMMKAQAALKGE